MVTVVATLGKGEKTEEISYTDLKVVGNGSFGVVYQASICNTNEVVAVKKVLQDRRFKVCSIVNPIIHQQFRFYSGFVSYSF